MRVFFTSDFEADSHKIGGAVEEEETMERISRTGLILSEMLFRVLSSLGWDQNVSIAIKKCACKAYKLLICRINEPFEEEKATFCIFVKPHEYKCQKGIRFNGTPDLHKIHGITNEWEVAVYQPQAQKSLGQYPHLTPIEHLQIFINYVKFIINESLIKKKIIKRNLEFYVCNTFFKHARISLRNIKVL
ncbi:hypothetical protein C1646_668705 [Rhizophagus diaphanus]|nr:hypothetical protein C1646_668705 [Rhizophagus diaphanus] [Rhizophagus sp. MUCL 43196]